MNSLTLDPNFDNADDFYAALLHHHDRLDPAQSHAFNARLVLILANHVGDQRILSQALQVAADSAGKTA